MRQGQGRDHDHASVVSLQLVHLYAERGSPKYEKAAVRWLGRYLEEGEPGLVQFARLASGLAKRMATESLPK